MSFSKLYVGNFPWSTTENELHELFGAYGELKSVKIIMDKETGRSRGFAFIEFVDPEAAQEAMDTENGRDFQGRELKVREAIDKPREPRDNRDHRAPRPPRPPQQYISAPPSVDRSYNGSDRPGNKRYRERPFHRNTARDYRD